MATKYRAPGKMRYVIDGVRYPGYKTAITTSQPIILDLQAIGGHSVILASEGVHVFRRQRVLSDGRTFTKQVMTTKAWSPAEDERRKDGEPRTYYDLQIIATQFEG